MSVAFETPAIEIVTDVRSQVGESPLWSVAEQALWWVDIDGRRLHRLDPASARTTSWPVEERIGCIGLHRDGGFVGALETGIFRLRPHADGRLAAERLARLNHPRPDMRFNDGRVDRDGRFWSTTMVRDTSLGATVGALYRFDARGLSAPLVPGLATGNGLAFSPDGRILYLSDSNPTVQKIWSFDLAVDGSLANRRLFVDMAEHPGRPDGAAVDADGCYWTCATDAGALLRFTPQGRLDRALKLPVMKPTMCAFGGAALDELYIASLIPARPGDGYDPALAGAVLRLSPGVRGLAERPFVPASPAA